MEYRSIGGDQRPVSQLGLGTLHFGLRVAEADAVRLVQRALDLGVTFVDTGPLYGQGRAEAILGKALFGRRNRCWVATKVGLQPSPRPDGSWGVRPERLTQQVIEASVDRSLSALGVERIDLLQLHAFDPDTPAEETATALAALVQAGKVVRVGCSNFAPDEIRVMSAALTAAGLTFATCQVHYNVIERRAGAALATGGVPLVCNRALARGILGGQYRPGMPPPPGSRGASSERVRQWLSVDTIALVEALDGFARELGHSIVELAIAWLTAQPSVATVLVGVGNDAQLLECARGAEWRLSENEVRRVDEIIDGQGLTRQVDTLPEDFFER